MEVENVDEFLKRLEIAKHFGPFIEEIKSQPFNYVIQTQHPEDDIVVVYHFSEKYKNWVRENSIGLTKIYFYGFLFFELEEDVVAFKLRW